MAMMTPEDREENQGTAPVVEGALVLSRAHRALGVGKIAALPSEGPVTVQYFDSVADPVATEVRVSAPDLSAWYPDRQRRVYFRSGPNWSVGRVVDEAFGRYCVRPPGRQQPDVWLDLRDLYVRWSRPLEDPVGVMQARGME